MRARASSTATQANGGKQERDVATEREAAKGSDQSAEEGMVEAEIEAEEDEDAGGGRLGQTAVEIHRLVDPVAIAEIPDKSGEVAEGSGLPDRKRAVRSESRPSRAKSSGSSANQQKAVRQSGTGPAIGKGRIWRTPESAARAQSRAGIYRIAVEV